jgi:hypothetical protein
LNREGQEKRGKGALEYSSDEGLYTFSSYHDLSNTHHLPASLLFWLMTMKYLPWMQLVSIPLERELHA